MPLYFDLLLPIIEASIGPVESQLFSPQDPFVRDIDEGLWDPPDMHEDAVADLLSFCQVSRVWAAAAQDFLFRHVKITRKRQLNSLITTIFTNQHLADQVRTVTIRPPRINRKRPPPISADMDYDDLLPSQISDALATEESDFDALPLFIHCPNIYRAELSPDMLVVGLADIQDAQQSDPHHFVPLSSITTFRVPEGGCLLNLCHVLKCLPSLRVLSLGLMTGTGEDITGLSSPTFQLEQLAVSDDWGIAFRSYNWLLQSSTHSLKSLSLHWLGGLDVGRDLWQALERCGPTLQHIYFNGTFFKVLSTTDLLSLCPNLTSLKFSLLEDLEEYDIGECLRGLKHPLEHLHISFRPYTDYFISSQGIEYLIRTIPSSTVLGKLKQLSIGAKGPLKRHLREPPIEALDRLRNLCKDRNIILDTLSNEELLGTLSNDELLGPLLDTWPNEELSGPS